MSNTLGVYNPIFYAQEALTQLEKALGMAGRVYRGYDEERRAFGRGETINIRRPSVFTAQDAPSTAQDANTGTVALTLNKWREVKFKLTDKELAFTGERIINDHIRPAAYALADDIDQNLVALYKTIPYSYTLNATPGSVVSDLTGPRQVLFDNKVPMDPRLLHYMVNGSMEANLLANSAFGQWTGAGPTGETTQVRGAMGHRFGMNLFANQNVVGHTSGTYADGSTDGAIAATVAAGETTISIDGTSITGTIVAGDVIEIAGHTKKYVATTTTTAAANAISVVLSPALEAEATEDDLVTVTTSDSTAENLAFHRNAFALAMAPLSEMGNELGAKIAAVTDPVTGLSIRSRIYYVGNSSEVHVALDVLYGVKTLDERLACRARD